MKTSLPTGVAEQWRQTSPRQRSYVIYAVVAAVVALAALWVGLNLDNVRCLQTAVGSTSAETLAGFDRPECSGEPFASISESYTDRSVPKYDKDLGVTSTSARIWSLIDVFLMSMAVSSGVAGAVMAPIIAKPDVTRGGWVWGGALACIGLVFAFLASIIVRRPLFEVTVVMPTGTERLVDYSNLLDWFGAAAVPVILISSAIVTAAIAAVGIELGRRTRNRDIPLFVTDYRRASATTTILITALVVTLSLGVLSTASYVRLLEHLPGMGDIPGVISMLYGAMFSLLVAALYVPTRTRLHETKRRLVEQLVGADTDPETTARRRALSEELEPGTSTATVAFTILGPLISAAASSLLS